MLPKDLGTSEKSCSLARPKWDPWTCNLPESAVNVDPHQLRGSKDWWRRVGDKGFPCPLLLSPNQEVTHNDIGLRGNVHVFILLFFG